MEWRWIETALGKAQGEVILLRDFNAHHPAWGGTGTACKQGAQHLLDEARRWELTMLTPQGETTWKRGPQHSVIDLTFASRGLCERAVFCGPEERWALPQDHIPVRLTLNISLVPEA